MKILVVDSCEANLEAAREQLTGHEVTTCSDFHKAQWLISHHDMDTFNVVLIDQGEQFWRLPHSSESRLPSARDMMSEGGNVARQACITMVRHVGLLTDRKRQIHMHSAPLGKACEFFFEDDQDDIWFMAIDITDSGSPPRWDEALEKVLVAR